MKDKGMKTTAWLGVAMAALLLTGCATGNREGAGGPVVTAPVQGAANPASGAYRWSNAVALREADNARVFYLIRDGAQWNFSFDAEAFKRSGGERLAYWPDGKKLAFVFDHLVSNDRTIDAVPMCDDGERNRAKQGYTLCTSAFSQKHTSGSTIFARTFVGVLTAGTSELTFAGKGAYHQRISQQEVLAALAPLDIDRQFWLRDYRQRADAGTVSGLNDFIRRYERDDPERLVQKARDGLARLGKNASILEAAERGAPKLADYRRRYMPANPKKYCKALKGNAADFQYCEAQAMSLVGTLADQRALTARRADVCQAVSKAVPGGGQPGMCQQYSSSHCRATTAPGQQVCDILNRKGQS